MDEGKMVAMVNRIALFFQAYPPETAVPEIADHIVKFWEPRFRRQLEEYARAGGEGLHELAKEALATLLEPPKEVATAPRTSMRGSGAPNRAAGATNES